MDKNLKIGDEAPGFILPNDFGSKTSLRSFRGNWVVLYFYPKDLTSGCTFEAIDFTATEKEFLELGARIIGVSADSVESHTKFRKKNTLTHILLSDEKKRVLQTYGALQMKRMEGKESIGIARITYLIDPNGVVAYIWQKVKVIGHADEVMEKLMELKKANK